MLGDGVEVHARPDPETSPPPTEALAGVDAVVNLLGEPVAQRWTETAKQRIRESRVHRAPARWSPRSRSCRPTAAPGLS